MKNRQSGQFSRPCPNCGAIIFAGKYSCESCGWQDEIIPSQEEKLKQGQIMTKSTKIIGLVGIVGALIVLAALINISQKKGQNGKVELSNNKIEAINQDVEKKAIFGLINHADKNEKEILIDAAYGDYRKAKKLKKSGKATLKVWQSYISHMDKHFGPAPYRVESLNVEYDEIWEREYTDFLTPQEIRDARKKGKKFNLNKLYWKNDKVQAFVLESPYIFDPYTGERFEKVKYKIIGIDTRETILDAIAK
jgi:uncharacterized membrane protein YvbJ